MKNRVEQKRRLQKACRRRRGDIVRIKKDREQSKRDDNEACIDKKVQ